MSKKNSGAALVAVLIIVFIVMAIISNISISNYRVIRKLTNEKVMEQSYEILEEAVNFGRASLATSAATSQADTLNDIWAQPLPKTKVMNDTYMGGYIIDEQSKFNINDLVTTQGQINPNVVKQFSTLLSELNLPTTLAISIAIYMAAPQYQYGILQQYTNDAPYYRPAGKPLVDLSELLLVKGMKPQWLNKLSEYITAIPVNNYPTESATESSSSTNNISPIATNAGSGVISVNVNTASAEVIAAKSGISLPIAQRMLYERKENPFQKSQDITTFLTKNGIMQNDPNNVVNISTLTTSSQYFTIHATVDKGDYEFLWVSLVYRPNRSGQWPLILWQHPE